MRAPRRLLLIGALAALWLVSAPGVASAGTAGVSSAPNHPSVFTFQGLDFERNDLVVRTGNPSDAPDWAPLSGIRFSDRWPILPSPRVGVGTGIGGPYVGVDALGCEYSGFSAVCMAYSGFPFLEISVVLGDGEDRVRLDESLADLAPRLYLARVDCGAGKDKVIIETDAFPVRTENCEKVKGP